MAAATLVIAIAWQWYNLRANALTIENDESCQTISVKKRPIKGGNKGTFLPVFDTRASRSDGSLHFTVTGGPSSTVSAFAGTNRKHSEDLVDSHTKHGPNPCTETKKTESKTYLEPSESDQPSLSQKEDHASVGDASGESQAPIVFGPNGSGYKGQHKSQKDYTATSAMYDYQGSYTQLGRKRHRAPDEDSDSDDADDSAGGGGGPGSGGGPPNGEPNLKVRKKKPEKAAGKYHESYREWKWGCCGCGNESGMDITATWFCPGCQHLRCEHCELESVKRTRHVTPVPQPPRGRKSKHNHGHSHKHKEQGPALDTCGFCGDAVEDGAICPFD